jgi:N-formylmaleamate deformylase
LKSTFQYGAHVRANGIRQHYLRYGGKGKPLVLVPGITSPAVTWGFVAERLGCDYDTYVLDVRGRGLSEAGPDLDYSLDACAADVEGFVSALGLDDYMYLGHSMGARIGVIMASHHPAGLERLVLVDPPVCGPGRRPYSAPLSWYTDSIRLALAGTDAEGMRPYLPSWTDAELQLRAQWLHTCDETAVTTSFHAFQQNDMHAALPHITVPTLLIVAGAAGVILPDEEADIRQLLPAIEVRHVEKAGHMIPWDDFDGFFDSLTPFLTVGKTVSE